MTAPAGGGTPAGFVHWATHRRGILPLDVQRDHFVTPRAYQLQVGVTFW